MTARASVVIVGGGASGALAAAQLARHAARRGRPLDLAVVDRAPIGQGLAYSTSDPRHRLNVAAKAMSAWPDDAGHFLRWLRRHVASDFAETGFAPRLHYAQYLESVLRQAVRDAPDVRLEHVRARVTDVRRIGGRLRLVLDDGATRAADAVVLATGHGEPSVAWAPATLRHSPRFLADPWTPGVDVEVRHGDQVVLVGAGLTAADMAQRWGIEGVRVHVVSRHGMLPLAHASAPEPPFEYCPEQLPVSLGQARRMVFATVRSADGDWRRAVDGLRPVTPRLWAALPLAERSAFVRLAGRRWDRARHRLDPAVLEWLERRRAEGSLIVHAGSVVSAAPVQDRVRVSLTDGSVIDAAAVLNCTGTCTATTANADPLVLNLLANGLARPGPLDLGFATDDTGRLSAAGSSSAIWAIGPLRRGELWESTAIPEIRSQADAIAGALIDSLPRVGARRRPRDPYGLPLSADSGAAAIYLEALGRILRVQSGADALVAEAVHADHGFALGHAVLAVLGTEWGADVDIDAALDAARAPGARADERERRFIDVATARVRRPGPESAAALLSYIHTYPEDALAVSLAVPTIAFGGATEVPAAARALVDTLAPAYGDDWWYLGLLAFTRQEQEQFAEAGELAARALSTEPAAGHAVHAKAHVHYETGDHRAGLAWLDGWIDTCGVGASHRAHFSWHAALHELSLGDDEAVARRYSAQLAPPDVTGVRALVDSASLLWRARMSGAPACGSGQQVLRHVPEDLLVQPVTPFVAMHAAIALAAADDCHGLARLRSYASTRPGPVFREVVAPLADALGDLVHGDAERAGEGLLTLDGVSALGGSAAQREIIQETLLYCAIRADRVDLASQILNERLRRRSSPRDRHRRDALIRPAHESVSEVVGPPQER